MLPVFQNKQMSLIRRTATHIYIAPHPLLRPYVAHYTFMPAQGASALPGALTIIPDASGCLVCTLEEDAPEIILFGASTQTVVVDNDVASCPPRVFVEFSPGGMCRFLENCQSDFTDLRLPLGDVNRSLQSLIVDAFHHADDLDGFFQALDRVLLSVLVRREPSPVLGAALELLKQTGGATSVKTLSGQSFCSERHLNRLFTAHIGVGVKAFSRILRINNAILRMNRGQIPLTALAQDSGFFDQPHFIHDFKAICGVTPRAYLAAMSGYYNESLKF